MKKVIAIIALVSTLSLTGCGGAETAPSDTGGSKTVELSHKAPDLTGDWKQTNSNSKDSYQQATITADTITVEWVTDAGDTTSTYWVGTIEAPTGGDMPYSWSSRRDVAATDNALLASTDETKEFTFDSGTISYKVSALGTTMTVKLKKS